MANQLAHRRSQPLAVALPAGEALLGLLQRLREDERRLPLLWREVDVATAHGEAVRLADGRERHDLDVQVQVAHHPPDHDELLGVLLAEVGAVGLDDVEELRHDGGHAAKVARSMRPLQQVVHARYFDEGSVAVAVDLLLRRQEDRVDLFLTEQR